MAIIQLVDKGKFFYFLLRVFKNSRVLILTGRSQVVNKAPSFFRIMDQERIGILLSKLLAGEATLPEQKELEMAFRDDPSLRETWNVLRALKEAPPGGLSVEEEQKMLEKGLQRLELTRQERPGLSVAARGRDEPVAASWQGEAIAAGGQEEPAVVMRGGRLVIAAAFVFVPVIACVALYFRHK